MRLFFYSLLFLWVGQLWAADKQSQFFGCCDKQFDRKDRVVDHVESIAHKYKSNENLEDLKIRFNKFYRHKLICPKQTCIQGFLTPGVLISHVLKKHNDQETAEKIMRNEGYMTLADENGEPLQESRLLCSCQKTYVTDRKNYGDHLKKSELHKGDKQAKNFYIQHFKITHPCPIDWCMHCYMTESGLIGHLQNTHPNYCSTPQKPCADDIFKWAFLQTESDANPINIVDNQATNPFEQSPDLALLDIPSAAPPIRRSAFKPFIRVSDGIPDVSCEQPVAPQPMDVENCPCEDCKKQIF